MIELRCQGTRRNGQNCNTILGRIFEDRIEFVCHRSDCHKFTTFYFKTLPYQSHKLLVLEKKTQK